MGACIRRRKSAVKALEWGLDRGQAASRTAKSIEAMLAGLDLERIIGQIMEATLYGYQPMEVSWQRVGGLWTPVDVQAKPPEWFCFDADNQLRFKSQAAPLLGELLHLPRAQLPVLLVSLALGTPLLSLLGAVVAALTVGMRRFGILVALLALPLYVPVLVFGAGSVAASAQGLDATGALLLLAAGLVLAAVLAPLVIAAAIRIAMS